MSIAARASGDTKLRHDAQRTINALMDKYDKIADAAGVDTQYSRMRVSGFKHTSDKELRKAGNGDIIAMSSVQTEAKQAAAWGITTKAGGDVNFICKLDRSIYSCVTKDITTDEVVISDERITHIKEHHPDDYERYCMYIAEMIQNPDYILENQPNTALILKEFQNEESEYFRLALRLKTSADNAEYKNSVITFMKTNRKKWEQNIRNKKILYRRLKE